MGWVDVHAIIDAIRAQYVLRWNGLHGVSHWARVYENGLMITQDQDVGQELILLFALFHDACRVNDGVDPGHGRRGADLAASLHGRLFELPEDELDRLYQACALHTDGLVQGDLAHLVCWDADRLDLARAAIQPRAAMLGTSLAKDPSMIAWASNRSRQQVFPERVRTAWGLDPI